VGASGVLAFTLLATAAGPAAPAELAAPPCGSVAPGVDLVRAGLGRIGAACLAIGPSLICARRHRCFHRRHWLRASPGVASPSLLLLAALRSRGQGRWGRLVLAGLAGLLPALLVPLWLGPATGRPQRRSYGACVEWDRSAMALPADALVISAAWPALRAAEAVTGHSLRRAWSAATAWRGFGSAAAHHQAAGQLSWPMARPTPVPEAPPRGAADPVQRSLSLVVGLDRRPPIPDREERRLDPGWLSFWLSWLAAWQSNGAAFGL